MLYVTAAFAALLLLVVLAAWTGHPRWLLALILLYGDGDAPAEERKGLSGHPPHDPDEDPKDPDGGQPMPPETSNPEAAHAVSSFLIQ